MPLLRFLGLTLLVSLSTLAISSRADTNAPIISLIGGQKIWHALGTNYMDLGATATDDIDGDITSKITISVTVDVSMIGDYTVIYSVSDAAGNEAKQVTRTVTVTEDLQVILFSSADKIIDAGGQQTYEVIYRTEPAGEKTSGFGLRFFHDTSKTELTLEPAEGLSTAECSVDFFGPQLVLDEANRDLDDATNAYLVVAIIAFDGCFQPNFDEGITVAAINVASASPNHIGPIPLNLQIDSSPGFAAVERLPSLSFLGDTDGDGVRDDLDAFLLDPSETLDTDADGTGNNADPDDDNDGVLDTADAFPLISLGSFTDTDGDGRPNDCDSSCTGLGMTADTDDDNDGVLDTADAFALISLGSLTDTDGDGRPDDCDSGCLSLGMSADSDDDGDGVLDSVDNCSATANADQLNTDGDSEGDSCDSDDDNDGVLDTDEFFLLVVDADEDGRTLPFSDGLVFTRFAAGLTNNSLTEGLGVTVDESQYSGKFRQNEFDIDGDGAQRYTSDGFRLIAALSGVCIESLPSDGKVVTCDEQASYLKPFTKIPPIIQRKWPDSASNSLELVVDVASAASQGLVKVSYKTEGNDPLYGFVLRVFYSSSEVQGLALKENLLVNDSSKVFTFFDDDARDLDANPATDKVFSYLGFGLFEQSGFSVNPKPLISASTSGDAFNLSFDAADNAAFFPYITELPFGYTATNPSSVSGLTFTDSDSDGWGNGFDNCSSIFNPEQDDFDSDSFGDACDSDDDGDGSPDASDAFPLDASESIDTDGDGIGNNSDTDDDDDGVLDAVDGYALISLGGLLDSDSDGFPNDCNDVCLATGMAADSDDDNDGVVDIDDFFPLDASESSDRDGDGVGDNSDAFPDNVNETVDSDVDGIGDNSDNCPNVQNSDQTNTDGDLFGNACDLDDDNDGNTDQREAADGTDPLDTTSCLNCVNNLATGGIRSLGSDGPDEIEGTDFDDVLSSFGGDDNISGSGGNDLISGGEGGDNLSGGSGDDDIQGDDGNDLLSGGSGDDVLLGGDGDDQISGGSGEDRIFGGDGADAISGGSGDDYIEGGAGSDLISGGSGADQLFGGDGADVISAGSGFNSVSGGSGEDIFTITSLVVSSELITQISDYEDGLDLIASYLPITAIKNYSDQTSLGAEEGVTIVFSDGRSFQLAGLEAESLTLDDFICFGENTSLSELNDSRNLQADCDLDGDGFSNLTEVADGTNPLNRFSCKSGCFSFDVDENLAAQPLTDGLLVIRHLFGFSGDSLTSGAVSGEASRDSSEAIAGYLTDADSELDIDGDGESKPLTDGLLLIRYLFGFSGDSLISGAIGDGAERDTADEVEAYIDERVPAN